MKVYVCGKMSGVKNHNREKFHKVTKELRKAGYHVENPAEIKGKPNWEWIDYMREALAKLLNCDVLYVISGYETSKGAKTEIQLAENLGMTIIHESKDHEKLFKTKPKGEGMLVPEDIDLYHIDIFIDKIENKKIIKNKGTAYYSDGKYIYAPIGETIDKENYKYIAWFEKEVTA